MWRASACRVSRERIVWPFDVNEHWLHSPNAACASRSKGCETASVVQDYPAPAATPDEEQKDEHYLSRA